MKRLATTQVGGSRRRAVVGRDTGPAHPWGVRRTAVGIVLAAFVLPLTSCTVSVSGVPAADARPASTSGASPPSSSGASPSNNSLVVTSVVPGWNTVRSVKRAALYDVPPDWTVNSEDTLVGYQSNDGKVLVGATGSASFGDDACGKNMSLAISAVKHSTDGDLAGASTAQALEWADAAFRDANDRHPTVKTEKPEQVNTLTGKPAVVVKVDATAAHATGTCGTKGAVYAISATGFTGELGPTAILIIVAGVGFDRAVPEAKIRQILTTLRPEK
jgi:hypothetical protein